MATAVGRQPRRAVGLIARLRAGDASHHSFDGESRPPSNITKLQNIPVFLLLWGTHIGDLETVSLFQLCSTLREEENTLLALKMCNSNCTNSIVTVSQGEQTYHYREDTRMERHLIDRCELLSISGDNEIPHLWAVTQTLSDVQYICALNFL